MVGIPGRWALVALAAGAAALALSATPGGATITSYPITAADGAAALAEAMTRDEAANTLVQDAYWLNYPPALVTAATSDAAIGPLFGIPSGAKYVLLATGRAADAAQPQASFASSGPGGVGRSTTFDVTTLTILIEVPDGDNCMKFTFQFLSEEYPVYVGTPYNDAFVAELDFTSWVSAGGVFNSPTNFARTPSGAPITVSTVPFSTANAAPGWSAPSAYDGGSALWTAQTPAPAGPHVLYLSIFDSVDFAYDSSVFLDDLHTFSVNDPDTDCLPGIQPPPPPPTPVACAPNAQTILVHGNAWLNATGGQTPYNWSAPGGVPDAGTGISFTPSYHLAGTYAVTVTDAGGREDDCQVVVVDPPLECAPPSQSAVIDGAVEAWATGGNGAYAWSAPGASPPSGAGSPFRARYGASGDFTIAVASGAQEATCAVHVAAVPVPSFLAAAGAGCDAWTVQFSDTSTSEASIASRYWEFGDGGTSVLADPTHTYAAAGTYRVTLTVTDGNGYTASGHQDISLRPSGCHASAQAPAEAGHAPVPPRDGRDPALARPDSDGDGVPDGEDACPWAVGGGGMGGGMDGDVDGDGRADACDADRDGDLVPNAADGCPDLADPGQSDLDGDGVGDPCDADRDGDGLPDAEDDCPAVENPSQADADGDGVGGACGPLAPRGDANGDANGAAALSGTLPGAGAATPSPRGRDPVAMPPAAPGHDGAAASIGVGLGVALLLLLIVLVALRRRPA